MKWWGKKISTITVILLTIVVLWGCQGPELGFATPEDAVLSYLAGMRDNDFDRMAASFGGGKCAEFISIQYAYLCNIDLIPEIEIDSAVILDESDAAEQLIGQITDRIEEANFENMEFLGFVSFDDFDDTDSATTYRDNSPSVADDYGGSEVANRIVAIRVNGSEYLLLFDLIKRDDRWYNLQRSKVSDDWWENDEEIVIGSRIDEEDKKILSKYLKDTALKLPEEEETVHLQEAEAGGFDTPWQAAVAYLEGMRSNDIRQMLSTFSVESYAQNYNLQAYTEYQQAYIFMHQTVKFPPVNDFVQMMIEGERRELLIDDILHQENTLYMCDLYLKGTPILENDIFLEWGNLRGKAGLNSIKVIGYILPEALYEEYNSERIKSFLDTDAAICGADQIQESIIVFDYKGERYCLLMKEAEYKGKWYNSSMDSRISIFLDTALWYEGKFPRKVKRKGIAPLEAIIDPADLEEVITYI